MDNRINDKQTLLLELLPALFEQKGEGESLLLLFADTNADAATEAELRALKDALMSSLIRWLLGRC